MSSNYVIIDTVALKCVNLILWDGQSALNLPANQIEQLSDGTIGPGDTVQLVNGVYALLTKAPAPSPAATFNVEQFKSDLLTALGADSNLFQYYAVLIDLANFQNFSGMKTMVAGLQTAGALTSDEVTALNGVLANQNIVLANF